MNTEFLKNNLLVATSAIIGICIIFGVHVVTASPTDQPPLDNPTYLDGGVGPTGNRGNTGGTGPQGYTGSAGAKGARGQMGMGNCGYSGRVWLSNGWDGGCAFSTGGWWYCEGGRLTRIIWETSGCNYVF